MTNYKGIISYEFNKNFFDVIFDHSSKVAISFIQSFRPDLIAIKNYDYRTHWENIYKEERERQDGFFIEAYEVLNEDKNPIGYYVARINNKTLICNTCLPGKRKYAKEPVVLDLQMWRDLFDFAKEQGCNKYIWETDKNGIIWKALKMMARKLDNDITFTEWQNPLQNGYSTMEIKLD